MNLPHELAVLWPAGVHGLRVAGAWCLTYLVHSTLLLTLAWGLSRVVAGRAPRAEEAIWRLALFAGFFTASLQLGWPALRQEAASLWRPAPAPVSAIVLDLAPPSAAVAAAGSLKYCVSGMSEFNYSGEPVVISTSVDNATVRHR